MTNYDYSPTKERQVEIDKENAIKASNRKTNLEWLVETHGVAHVFGMMLDKDKAYHLNWEANSEPNRFQSIYK